MEDIIVDETFTVRPASDGGPRYVSFDVKVDSLCSRIEVELNYESVSPTQIPIAIFDPNGTLRGILMREYSQGKSNQVLWAAESDAGPGALPGPISSGTWWVVVYGRHTFEPIPCRICVKTTVAEDDRKPHGVPEISQQVRKHIVLNSEPGWYCGELHMHSSHSTGRTGVGEIISVARKCGLDFVAITDHFSVAHWRDIDLEASDQPPLVLHSTELSGERGHANLHGITRGIDPFVDAGDELGSFPGHRARSMNDVADMVHEQGGLFCINHPLSASVSWRYDDFDIAKADILEVIGLPDGPNSFLYPTFWDRYLCAGFRLTGTGSSDSHDPTSDGPWRLGVLRTWVNAEELSEPGILGGLASGNVYVASTGVRMSFLASLITEPTPEGALREMGSTVTCPNGASIRFHLRLSGHPPGNLYIMKDGLVLDVLRMNGADGKSEDWESVSFDLFRDAIRVDGPSYCRVEYHEETVKPAYVGMAYRDHTTIRALSNPIWMNR